MKDQLSIQEEKRQYEKLKEIFEWDESSLNDTRRIFIEVTSSINLIFEYQRNKVTSWLEISTGTMGFDQAWDCCPIRKDPVKWMNDKISAVNILFGYRKPNDLKLPLKENV